MSTPPPRLELIKDLAHHLRQGHPWVFRNALGRLPRLPAGEVVDITQKGQFVARGLYDPLSPIAVRIYAQAEHQAIDTALFTHRLSQAAALRRQVIDLDRTDSFRLVHGESDFLPGVVADLYAGFVVLKLYSAALTPHRASLVEALRAAWPGLRGVFGGDEDGREDDREGNDRAGKVLFGEAPPERVAIREEALRLWVDVRSGQKTGLFLDQRENRLALRRYARDREVLNCFAYSGGFSVSAALGGAGRVVSLDLDGDPIALARENFELNQIDPSGHDFMVGDVFKWL